MVVYPHVSIRATVIPFVPGRSKDSPLIYDLVNLSEIFGHVRSDQLDVFEQKVRDLVADKDGKQPLVIHWNDSQDFSYEPRAFDGGCLWARKEKVELNEFGTKATKGKLYPIQTQEDFSEAVEKLGVDILEKKTRNSTHVKERALELCIMVMGKKKEKKRPCPESELPCAVRDRLSRQAPTAKQTTPKKAKKDKKNVFKMKARKMKIKIFSPLIQLDKHGNGMKISLPPEALNYVFMYDFSRFIVKKKVSDDDSVLSSDGSSLNDDVDDDEEGDEDFSRAFSCSYFRKIVMDRVLEDFSEAYNLKDESLGRKSILYMKEKQNSSTWTALTNTENFHEILLAQMDMNNRVDKNGSLQVQLAFGTPKEKQAFKDDEDVDDYLNGTGDNVALCFEQENNGTSPKRKVKGRALNKMTNDRCKDVRDLLSKGYRTEGCLLENGFLDEHIAPLLRLVMSDMRRQGENSPFVKALEENELPSNKDIEEILLMNYDSRYNDEVPGNLQPETHKYPPTNPNLRKPPYLSDWRKSNKQDPSPSPFQNNNPFFSMLGLHPSGLDQNSLHNMLSPMPSFASPSINSTPVTQENNNSSNTNNNNNNDDPNEPIVVLNFCVYGVANLTPSSIYIIGDLNKDSKMNSVLQEASLHEEFEEISDISKCKFHTLTTSGRYISQPYKRFIKLTVKQLISGANVSPEHIINVEQLK